MDLLRQLAAIERSPERYLDCPCALSLEVFMAGYRGADASATPIVRSLAVPVKPEISAFGWAYLSYPTREAGMTSVLERLREAFAARSEPPQRGPLAGRTFVEVVREPIRRERAAMLFGTPRVAHLFNFANGLFCGLDVVNPESAERQRSAMVAFEIWLQAYCRCPGRWYRLVEVFYGDGADGLKAFIELWDRFERGQ